MQFTSESRSLKERARAIVSVCTVHTHTKKNTRSSGFLLISQGTSVVAFARVLFSTLRICKASANRCEGCFCLHFSENVYILQPKNLIRRDVRRQQLRSMQIEWQIVRMLRITRRVFQTNALFIFPKDSPSRLALAYASTQSDTRASCHTHSLNGIWAAKK